MGDANGKPSDFPCLRDVLVTRLDADLKWYNDKIAELLWEIFRYLVNLRQNFQFFHSPFTVKPSDVLVDIQLEIIHLQYNANLKGTFASVGHILSISIARVPQINSPGCKNFEHVWDNMPL